MYTYIHTYIYTYIHIQYSLHQALVHYYASRSILFHLNPSMQSPKPILSVSFIVINTFQR